MTNLNKLQESGRAIVIDPTNAESEERAITQIHERLGQAKEQQG